jgi:hypothetical protein
VYRATIKADDIGANPALSAAGGPFGCDGNKSRPGNAYGSAHFKARTDGGGQFFVALPNVMNNIPVNTTVVAPCTAPGCGIGQANAPNVAPPLAQDTGVGCYFPKATPAATNLVNQTNNPVNGAWFWDCDGGLLYLDPLRVEAAGGFGAAQPSIAPFVTQTPVAPIAPAIEVAVPGPIVVNTTSLAVVKLPYCSPGVAGAGRFGGDANLASDPPFNNLFLGCNPAFNGGTISTGNPVSIAETYSLLVNVATDSIDQTGSTSWYAPGPFPAQDTIAPFSSTIAFQNPGDSGIVPATPGCSTQLAATVGVVPPTNTTFPVNRTDCKGPLNTGGVTFGGIQVPGGQIIGYPFANTLFVNGVTSVRLVGVEVQGFNDAAFGKDPHYYAAVGARFFSAANVTNLASRTPVLAYIDALSNLLVEYTPTSSGSNTVAFDDQFFRAFLPVNGVVTPKLPAGDFTGNGIKLCGNATIANNGISTGPGCVVYFRQQYLSN